MAKVCLKYVSYHTLESNRAWRTLVKEWIHLLGQVTRLVAACFAQSNVVYFDRVWSAQYPNAGRSIQQLKHGVCVEKGAPTQNKVEGFNF